MPHRKDRRYRGFQRAASLVETQIRGAGESRGFAQSKLLTQWQEIVGTDVAAMCRPVKVSYGKGSLGATLLVLTTGANAPILQTQLPRIKDRVNACYGYAAIARIKITQTAPIGFSEGRASFETAATPPDQKPMSPEIAKKANRVTSGVKDSSLAAALERLGQNVLSKPK